MSDYLIPVMIERADLPAEEDGLHPMLSTEMPAVPMPGETIMIGRGGHTSQDDITLVVRARHFALADAGPNEGRWTVVMFCGVDGDE